MGGLDILGSIIGWAETYVLLIKVTITITITTSLILQFHNSQAEKKKLLSLYSTDEDQVYEQRRSLKFLKVDKKFLRVIRCHGVVTKA